MSRLTVITEEVAPLVPGACGTLEELTVGNDLVVRPPAA